MDEGGEAADDAAGEERVVVCAASSSPRSPPDEGEAGRELVIGGEEEGAELVSTGDEVDRSSLEPAKLSVVALLGDACEVVRGVVA